ncbi:uncharacterized protein EI97DRAFT_433698 [Westerdykella ornata]|uniref:Response regulatory domain-containing protein n=1 Tax=Westerdykella ornata TaxID=318751 RepID=A0A6A6JJ75_WESOR|nr:uncharacterized protein EI97DRAFT_433698 [Westerdykella ornata]KAF2276295.1 hypothetical protein EI97DRAFT_433698 [Westerdykella ornata]
MDFKTKLSNARQRLPLLRRGSQHSTSSPRSPSQSRSEHGPSGGRRSSMSASLTKLPAVSSGSVSTAEEKPMSKSAVLPPPRRSEEESSMARNSTSTGTTCNAREPPRHSQDNTVASAASTSASTSALPSAHPHPDARIANACPAVTLEGPTPVRLPVDAAGLQSPPDVSTQLSGPSDDQPSELPPSSPRTQTKSTHPGLPRRQSLVTSSNARVIKTLLQPEIPQAAITSGPPTTDYFAGAPSFNTRMLNRKIWVKRPNASATLVQIKEDDVVDDVREVILRKYANSLGKVFDAPDISLRIYPRDATGKSAADRLLGPEEEMCRTLDAYYPGGQTINEALLIEVPQRRTPRPSPRVPVFYAHHDDSRFNEQPSEYFPPMGLVNPSPAALTAASQESRASVPPAHSIAVLSTGQLPNLPSPGSARKSHHGRPKYPRHNTASPTALTGAVPSSAGGSRPPQRARHDSIASETKHSTSSGNHPIPTPPAPVDSIVRPGSNPPTPRVASPRPDIKKRRKAKPAETPSLPAELVDTVPPINVLIVEDNIINLRVLGAFMQRLKVRWAKAMNGKEAVMKWKSGGFHLVLMDIQLPIMNGLEATKEIRRLERVNNIGVFSSGSNEAPNNRLGEGGSGNVEDDDKLGDRSLFKSPVIIVALTASSLQSDRHEALAAGCNDFLTKPVNFVWLERKVKEWGCMQALIDYDGWRKWKDFAPPQNDTTTKPVLAPKPKPPALAATSPTSGTPTPSDSNGFGTPPTRPSDEERKNKRRSLGPTSRPPPLPEEDSNVESPDVDS